MRQGLGGGRREVRETSARAWGLRPRRLRGEIEVGVSGDPSSARGGEGDVSGGSLAGRRGIRSQQERSIRPSPCSSPLLFAPSDWVGLDRWAPETWRRGAPGSRARADARLSVLVERPLPNPWKGFSVFLNRMALGRLAGHLEKWKLAPSLTA